MDEAQVFTPQNPATVVAFKQQCMALVSRLSRSAKASSRAVVGTRCAPVQAEWRGVTSRSGILPTNDAPGRW